MARRWTAQEDAILRKHAANMLGCTPSTVSVAIHELEKKEDK